MRSKKDKLDLEANKVKIRIGNSDVYRDLLDFKVYDINNKEYKLSELFDLILELKKEIKELKARLKKEIEVQNKTDTLIVKSTDLLSLKVSQLESDVKDLIDKTKFL